MNSKDLRKLKEITNFKPKLIKFNEESKKYTNDFNCGLFQFNNFIKEIALKDKSTGDGVTYLIIDKASSDKLVAYFTISTSTLCFIDRYDYEDDEIPEKEKREYLSPISAFIIDVFAVNKEYQDSKFAGQLVSSIIIKKIISVLNYMSTNVIGAKFILLCAIDTAVQFYISNGFLELEENYSLLDKIDAQDTTPMYIRLHK